MRHTSDLYRMAEGMPSCLVATIGATGFTSGALSLFQIMNAGIGFLVGAGSLFLLWPKIKKDFKERFLDDRAGDPE